MLQLLKIKEFSQEVVTGKEPSLTLVVPDVICNNCQSIIDLDICRGIEDSDIWPCKYCDSPLNKH
jgi:DNA polymerase epsilon subunit 1